MSEQFASDIPLEVAYAAHAGTSFVPGDRAKSVQADYAATLAADLESLRAIASDEETLATEFARYREGYRRRYLAMLASRSRIVSTMIAGGSNFPVRRMEKRNATANKRTEELIEFRKRALAAIREKFCPSERPVMSGDVDAVPRLRELIAEAEALQERMKLANSLIRKHLKAGHDAKLSGLVAAGFGANEAAMLLKPDCMGCIGYPDYRLKNNGANIRRMKARASQLELVKSQPTVEREGAAATIEDCPAENRVRIFFPGKPDASVRDTLKSAGFRWAPSLGCWQSYCSDRARRVANEVAKVG